VFREPECPDHLAFDGDDAQQGKSKQKMRALDFFRSGVSSPGIL